MSFNPFSGSGIPDASDIQDAIEQAQQESTDSEQTTEPTNTVEVGRIDDIVNDGSEPEPEPEPQPEPAPGPALDPTQPLDPPDVGPGGIPQGDEVSTPTPDPEPTPDTDQTQTETPQGVPPNPEEGPGPGQDTQDTPDVPQTGPGGIPVGEEVGNQGTPTEEQTSTLPTGAEYVYGGEMVELGGGRLVSDSRFQTLQQGLNRIQEQNPGAPVDEVSDIRLGENEQGQRVFETSTQFGEEQYAAAVEEQTGESVTPEDVIQSDQGPVLGPAALDRVQIDATEQAAVDQFDERFPGVDIGPEDVTADADGSAELMLGAQREIAAQQLDEQTGANVETGDVQFTGEGFQLAPDLQEQLQQRQAATDIAGTTPEQREVTEANAPPEQQGQDIQLDPSAIDPRGPEMPDNVGLSQDVQQNQQVTAAPDFSVPSPEDSPAVRQAQQARTQDLSQEFPTIAQDIEQSLEEDTGVELSLEDIVLTQDGQQISGRLSEQGQEQVEVENTPGGDLPVVGGVFETGTRIRQDVREATEGPRQAFQSMTPDADSVVGLLGAAAPVAAAEPTPFGEIGLAGATITAGALIGASTLSEDVVGQDPTARTSELVPSGSVVDQSELQPSETTQDQTELTPTGTTVDQTELDVSGDIQTPEVSVPTGSVFGPELSVSETTDTTQTGEPTGETVVPSDFPLAGRDVPADPTREYTRPTTPESVLDTSPAFQTPEQQERTEQRQRETITGDDIPTTIEEPDQPGPSVRERQRREGLFAPQRQFPTGEDAVVGRETTETVEETQRRVQEAQTPFAQVGPIAPSARPLPFLSVDERTDAAERQEVATEPIQRQRPELVQEPAQVPQTDVRPQTELQVGQLPGLDVQQTQIQEQGQEQRQVQEQATENPTENRFAQEPAYGYPAGFGAGQSGRCVNLPVDLNGDGESDKLCRPKPNFDMEATGDGEQGGSGGRAAGIFTSFANPLTGETLETDPEPQEERFGAGIRPLGFGETETEQDTDTDPFPW